ncbi:hypothetical protein POM88_027272 [Heracleum sosnowskyi]|uniref:PB1-like domain-containing protein n=1 Tax=Heracleum sosnowskyi TaxID=360622 RepID=A0AAD8I859_9APIA|nr:hypothetical protein POM88_027272 [Heracleum sosnowskyi]
MCGRLRVVADGKTTWAEVPSEYWAKVLEKDKEVPVIDEPVLPVGTEIPNYGASSKYFTIKVHHGGDFDDDLNGYHGGEISYFDMCTQWHFNIYDMESMMTELGLELGQFCLWFYIPDTEIVQGLIPLVKSEDVETLSDFVCYSSCLNLYTTDSMIDFGSDFNDFSFTQFEEDERIERIEQIREEREYGDEGEELPKEDEGVEDDKLSFEGDSSNVDSSDSEVHILPKKKKIIPPQNPPYRTRKMGRYSMLRGLFKNTEDKPIVLDDTGLDASQPSQEEVDGKGKWKVKPKNIKPRKRVKKKRSHESDGENEEKQVEVQVDPVDDTEQHDQVDPVEDIEHEEDHQEDLIEDIVQKIEDSSSEDGYNSDDERMAMSSCDEEEFQFPEFNKMTVQQPNVKSSPVKYVLRSSFATATHGGIIRPFKPPTQKKGPNCMDVEAVEGQKFTSLKNLQATRSMMQKNMGKRQE